MSNADKLKQGEPALEPSGVEPDMYTLAEACDLHLTGEGLLVMEHKFLDITLAVVPEQMDREDLLRIASRLEQVAQAQDPDYPNGEDDRDE